MSWSNVCMEKKDKGLGIKNLSSPNMVLLGKWSWRFASENEPFWKLVIIGKYGEEKGGWCFGASKESHGMGLWKAIKNGWLEFGKRVAFKVENGRKVQFWNDRWCGENALKEDFPSLYFLASFREAWVALLWDGTREVGHWNLVFTRHNNDWEIKDVEALFRKLNGQVLRRDDEDVMNWWISKKGLFTVKSFYSFLAPCNVREFPSSIFWNWVSNKVSCFAWEAFGGRILTMDQLKRRGWSLPSRWFMCKAEEESANHLLLHCPKATMI